MIHRVCVCANNRGRKKCGRCQNIGEKNLMNKLWQLINNKLVLCFCRYNMFAEHVLRVDIISPSSVYIIIVIRHVFLQVVLKTFQIVEFTLIYSLLLEQNALRLSISRMRFKYRVTKTYIRFENIFGVCSYKSNFIWWKKKQKTIEVS